MQDLLRRSGGLNLGIDYLPGALDFDPPAFAVDAGPAGRVLWFDALINNVDRSWRNPNLLVWHGRPWLIDHGAALDVPPSLVARHRRGHPRLPGDRGARAARPRPDPSTRPRTSASRPRSPTTCSPRSPTPSPESWLADDPARERQAYVDLLSAAGRERRRRLPAVERARAAHV